MCKTGGCLDSAETCEVSARVLGHGRRHLCRGAEAVSLGLAIQQSIEISQLRLIDKVFDDLAVQQVPGVQTWRRRSRFHSCSSCLFSGADVEKTVEIPQLQLGEVGLVTF